MPSDRQEARSAAQDRAKALWRECDRLRERARQMRDEADALQRAAERLNRMAAAIADGRDDDLVQEALSVGR